MARLTREYRQRKKVRYFERSRWTWLGWHQTEVKQSHRRERQQARREILQALNEEA